MSNRIITDIIFIITFDLQRISLCFIQLKQYEKALVAARSAATIDPDEYQKAVDEVLRLMGK